MNGSQYQDSTSFLIARDWYLVKTNLQTALDCDCEARIILLNFDGELDIVSDTKLLFKFNLK